MNCEDIYLLLSAKLDGALSASEEEQLNAHLASCADCRKLYDAMFEIEEKTKELAQPAPEGLKSGVMYRIRQESGTRSKKRGFFGFGTGLGAVAAVLVLLIGAGVVRLPKHALSSQKAVSAAYDATGSAAETNSFTPATEQNDWKFTDSKTVSVNGAASAGTQELQAPDAVGAKEEAPAEHGAESSTKSTWFPMPHLNKQSEDAVQDALCRRLSAEAEAPVLLYSDFSDRSLLTLLEDTEPKLYERLTENGPMTAGQVLCEAEASDSDAQPTVYRVDYESLLALQEWLLLNLPQTDPSSEQTESRLRIRLEELDPGSGALSRIITWTAAAKSVVWPEDWPEDWVERLRSGESWKLYYPAEDYIPKRDAAAYLVFPAVQTEDQ